MPITLQEKAQPELKNTENPDGVTYRIFDCPHCGFTIAFRVKDVHKCRRCDKTLIVVLRLAEQTRYRLAYHHNIVDDHGVWHWDDNPEFS
jgi:hypothetical protein